MFRRWRKPFKITAVRLTIVYSLLFGITALGLIFYVTAGTVKILKQQVTVAINDELSDLSKIYNESGLNGTILSLQTRSRAPGANLYVVANPAGQILVGNVLELQNGVLNVTGWTRSPFSYSRFGETGKKDHQALARIVELPNGMRLLVGRDIGEPEKYRGLIFSALALALGAMVVLGLLAWFFVGKRVLKRIDLVSQSTDRIMSGDREERLPINGSGDEFDRLSTRLNLMLERINQLDEGLKQVSDNIAHDLKTPLTRIRNTVESALTKSATKQNQHDALTQILDESEKLIKSFNALLMISRVESGSTAARLDQQNISQIVADMVELYQPAAEEQGFTLSANINPDLEIRANRELLSQLISNLIDNAIKYGETHDGSDAKIDVTLNRDAKGTVLSVADNGIGIPEQAREQVLQRYFRLEKARNLPGSGLGLSLVNAVAKLHGASVTLADNKPGLIISINFPKTSAAKP